MTTRTSQQIQSTIKDDGQLDLRIMTREVGAPEGEDIILKMEAAPINPSDVATIMFGPADLSTVDATLEEGSPVVTATVPHGAMRMSSVAERINRPIPVGNEGAGVVVDAGPDSQHLIGRTVAVMGRTYSQFLKIKPMEGLVMPEGVTPRQAAAPFVNPLTALGMVETMRLENHKALVHTAAASNLGQMLVKLCQNEGVDLVCIVRKPEQEELLRGLGQKHIVNSSGDDFLPSLIAALKETGATLAFDAIGGGDMADKILTAMEVAQSQIPSNDVGRYGTTVHKQVYLYGGLDRAPTTLKRGYGMAWGVGGFLMPNFLARVGMKRTMELRAKVASEITTTFASDFDREISLTDALKPEMIAEFTKHATGQKFVVNPNLGL